LHAAVDVLQRKTSQVHELGIQAPCSGIVKRPRYDDTAWSCFSFQSRCYVDAVSIDVIAVYDDIAKMEADPEHDALFLRMRAICFLDCLLELYGRLQSLDRASELGQCAIARQFDQPAPVPPKSRLQLPGQMVLHPCEGTGFIPAHVAGVADDIGSHDSG
jgi:hypothetical protein